VHVWALFIVVQTPDCWLEVMDTGKLASQEICCLLCINKEKKYKLSSFFLNILGLILAYAVKGY